QVSADPFKSCMNGVTGEAEAALADGTVIRGVFGFYLPYDPEIPRTGFLQRSSDETKTWGKRVVLLDVARVPAGSRTRAEFGKLVEPMLVVSSDKGKTWDGPIAVVPKEQRD